MNLSEQSRAIRITWSLRIAKFSCLNRGVLLPSKRRISRYVDTLTSLRFILHKFDVNLKLISEKEKADYDDLMDYLFTTLNTLTDWCNIRDKALRRKMMRDFLFTYMSDRFKQIHARVCAFLWHHPEIEFVWGRVTMFNDPDRGPMKYLIWSTVIRGKIFTSEDRLRLWIS